MCKCAMLLMTASGSHYVLPGIGWQQKEEGGEQQKKGRFRDNDGLAALLAVRKLFPPVAVPHCCPHGCAELQRLLSHRCGRLVWHWLCIAFWHISVIVDCMQSACTSCCHLYFLCNFLQPAFIGGLQVQLNADLLMLCTDVDGLFTGNPSDPASEFIPTYCPEVRPNAGFRVHGSLPRLLLLMHSTVFVTHPALLGRAAASHATIKARFGVTSCWSSASFCCRHATQVHKEMISFASKSTHGRGGMMAKVEAAWMAAEQGCSVVILNGKKPDSILQVRHALSRRSLSISTARSRTQPCWCGNLVVDTSAL